MPVLRIATYNIHKGVQGIGLGRRLEIHNLGLAVEQFDADIVCLQEVRKMNHSEARRFSHWPALPQADFLAPAGYIPIYRTNAITRHGEHGNALLSRWPVLRHQHEDMSDHRLEQRGLLHVEVQLEFVVLHVVVVHLGLIRGSRVRQLQQLVRFAQREIPPDAPLVVAGDFNDWGNLLVNSLAPLRLQSATAHPIATFPSRLPLVQFDHVFTRGLTVQNQLAPRGAVWRQMSDHLPLVIEFATPGRPQ